jgi:hypothetical protein
VGDHVHVLVQAGDLHRFDPDTGVRLDA